MARLPRVPGKRGTKVGRGGRTANQRLSSMKGRAMKKDFGRRLLKGFGLSGDDFKQSSFVHKKLGLFDKPLSEKKSSSKGVDLPALMTPEKVSNETAPDISAIVKQLNSLLKTANKLGVLTKEQQDAFVQQIKSAKRVAKEQAMEASVVGGDGAALAGSSSGIDGGAITPLNDAMQQLAESLAKLTDIVKEKIDESEEDEPERGFVQRLAEQFGLGEFNEERKAKQAKQRPTLREGFKTERGKNGGVRYRNAKGQFVKEAEALATKKTGILGRGVNAVKSRAAKASSGTAKIVNAMKGGVAKSATKGAAVRVATKETIQRLAKPLLIKSIGKTALKSIPILGALAGAGFAAQRLMNGDVVGAGIEATSGLAGPLTALPALALSVSRDIYSSLYGIQPEQDPEFASRMGVVLGFVKESAADMLKGSIQPKESLAGNAPGSRPVQTQAPKIPQAPPQAEKKSGPTASSMSSSGGGETSTPAPSIPSSGAKPSETSPSSSGGMNAIPSPVSSSTPPAEASKPAASVAEQTPISIPTPSQPSAVQEQPLTKTGQSISQASVENNSMASGTTQAVFPGTSVPKPAATPTSRTGARGMGNVPDPTFYDLGILPAQLYFRQVA